MSAPQASGCAPQASAEASREGMRGEPRAYGIGPDDAPRPTLLGRAAVFAGTTEGHELCRELSARGMGATAFVATDYGAELLRGLPGIEVRTGRLAEPEMEATLSDSRCAGGPDDTAEAVSRGASPRASIGSEEHAGGARPYGGARSDPRSEATIPAAPHSARFDVVVDATHPYAAEASANIRAAAGHLGICYLRLLRPATIDAALPEPGSDTSGRPPASHVVEVPDAAAAVRFLAGTEGPILLTTGSKDLPTFAALPDFATRLYARVLPDAAAVARARELGFPPAHLICMQGPFPREMNVATLRMVGARWMVTKDAGRPGGMPEKIAAAREAGVDLVVIARPPEPGTTYSFERVLALLVGDAPCP